MKGKRFTEEQIIGVLKESEAGAESKELCRRHGITATTFYRWKARSGVPSKIGSPGESYPDPPPAGHALRYPAEK